MKTLLIIAFFAALAGLVLSIVLLYKELTSKKVKNAIKYRN
jgi:hypothetical protein